MKTIKKPFEGTRNAGYLASGAALDEVAKIVKPGIKLMRLINFALSI